MVDAPPDTRPRELKVGSRILRADDMVKIKGARGLFRIMQFNEARTEVTVYGGPPNREHTRIFVVERIGARPRKAPTRKEEA